MTWVAPRTWTDAETLTTVILNAHFRDELLALLTVPLCRLTSSVNTSTPNTGTETLLNFNTTEIDTDSMADLVNDRIKVNTIGKYVVGGEVLYQSEASPAGYRALHIIHHRGATATAISRFRGPQNSAGNTVAVGCSTAYDCQVNDYFDIWSIHTAATNPLPALTQADFSPSFWAYRSGT